jgi:hypothetical protein
LRSFYEGESNKRGESSRRQEKVTRGRRKFHIEELLRGRKQQEAGENSIILRSFIKCTPHNYSSNQIKVEMGRTLGMHVEDKYIQGFDIKKRRTKETAVTSQVYHTITGLKEIGRE